MWLLLAGALLTLQFSSMFSVLLLFITFVVATLTGVLAPAGVLIVMMLSLTAYSAIRYKQSKYLRILTEAILVITSFALMMHMIPGFNNLKVLDSVITGPLSAPFTMYYNLDKSIIPFLLLACVPVLFKTEVVKPPRSWMWLILIVSGPLLLLIAVYTGGLRFERHTPEWIFSFILANLFFVSLAEEAFFRGYLQNRLSQIMHPYLSLIVTSALFGALHYSGGLQLMVFAGLAGLIYGLAWMWSGRVWVSTLFHFGLNLFHLMCFTYPLYKPA